MELIAITLARLTALIQLHSWDPFGKTSSVDVIQTLGNSFTFAKYPKAFAELDPQKGIELADGRYSDLIIDKITIYPNGIVVDTRSGTDNSEKILEAVLHTVEAFGAHIQPVRKTYISQFVFKSSMRLLSVNPIVDRIADMLTNRVGEDLKHQFNFKPTALLIGPDLSQARVPPGVFSVERLAESPFSENLYFSAAPLRTSEHIEIIQEFESALLTE